MAKFFVGQKVRVIGVKKECNRFLIGTETVIVSQYAHGWVCSCSDNAVAGIGFAEEDLEPILPEGHRPVEISKLMTEFPELEQVLGVSA